MREKLIEMIRKADKEDNESLTQDVHYAFMADNLIANGVTIPVRCKDCKHLNVLNKKEIYAHCPKTNTVFRPFDIDTREHFCSRGERRTDG